MVSVDAMLQEWRERLAPEVARLVRIPSVSPAFDRSWAERGHLDEVVGAAAD
ncbi:hypothetical protein [Nakamurella endophytica]|uniref:Uncharacterized protein n=1 Tax=Nakamurella endophytica TaxID=1748367 RepID=A0A917SVH7_9ACTN|nr:hypothetical protein [Nakamurella endophytica]GGL98080.1 hypothetical protein GCM10011594_17430 [Nakamurella endophytica]